MSTRIIKQHNWPFPEGVQAQLIWIRAPLKQDRKQMIQAYFRANGITKCIEADWGTLPLLEIQHYYTDGKLNRAAPAKENEIIEITIDPHAVRYSEKEWSIQGTKEKDISQSFIVTWEGEKYTLPLIEVIKAILAPNRFLLYQIFEPHAFPLYFHHEMEDDKLHFHFTSLYDFKYTKTEYLLQLAWLVSHSDVFNVFECIEANYLSKGKLTFNWAFEQPITIKVLAKPNLYGYTVLSIRQVLNKQLPFKEIIFTHPDLKKHERSKEPKNYILINKNRNAENQEVALSEEFDGATSNFDIIDLENQSHEYTIQPKIRGVRSRVEKQRSFEDENTKVYYLDDQGKRSTADVGGYQLARGLEHKPLHEIKEQGELNLFIQTLMYLENVDSIKSVRAYVDCLPDVGGERRFKYLNDGNTRRRYVWAEIILQNGKLINVLEVEREFNSLSTLFLYSESVNDYSSIIQNVLSNLIYDHGSWTAKSISSIREMGIEVSKLKHGINEPEHRAGIIVNHIGRIG